MKKIVISGPIVFALALLAPQLVQGQGTAYLSSLSQSSTGSLPLGNDYWLAAAFRTGTNAGGYLLDSVQLAMTDASGNPSGFTVMLYGRSTNPAAVLPGGSLGTLTGSLSPVTSGVFTYTPASSLTLSPSAYYFIVLTAGSAVADGAYQWSLSAYPPTIRLGSAGNAVLHSGDGASGWSSEPYPYPYSGIAQYAINTTGIPEPDVFSLFVLGGVRFLWHCRKAKTAR